MKGALAARAGLGPEAAGQGGWKGGLAGSTAPRRARDHLEEKWSPGAAVHISSSSTRTVKRVGSWTRTIPAARTELC